MKGFPAVAALVVGVARMLGWIGPVKEKLLLATIYAKEMFAGLKFYKIDSKDKKQALSVQAWRKKK